MHFLRTTPDHPAYRHLIPQLDAFLAVTDGEEHDFYDQYNGSDDIPYALVVLADDGTPLACGALKPFGDRYPDVPDGAVEVKRMFTVAAVRGRGIAVRVLEELESWARELGFRRALLETGKRQTSAVRLYEKCGYEQVDNYGPYREVENSVCMQKRL